MIKKEKELFPISLLNSETSKLKVELVKVFNKFKKRELDDKQIIEVVKFMILDVVENIKTALEEREYSPNYINVNFDSVCDFVSDNLSDFDHIEAFNSALPHFKRWLMHHKIIFKCKTSPDDGIDIDVSDLKKFCQFDKLSSML